MLKIHKLTKRIFACRLFTGHNRIIGIGGEYHNSQIQQVVTDDGTPNSDLTLLQRAGINVSVAALAQTEHPLHAAHSDQ
jgi:hypothetical protein